MMNSKHPRIVKDKIRDLRFSTACMRMYSATRDEKYRKWSIEAAKRAKWKSDNMQALSEMEYEIDRKLGHVDY